MLPRYIFCVQAITITCPSLIHTHCFIWNLTDQLHKFLVRLAGTLCCQQVPGLTCSEVYLGLLDQALAHNQRHSVLSLSGLDEHAARSDS